MTYKKTMVSGVKPTGRIHIGNYFGAIRQIIELSKTHNSFAFIADLHALTTVQNPNDLQQMILDVAIDYFAVGLDPKETTIFLQSSVSSHAELAWVFNCITTMPYLMRAHAFKDAEAKNKEINIGVFGYPLLMAADILLYGTDIVPVGKDQKQHVEIARDTAQKFNRTFSKIFKLPEPLILSDVGVVPGTDGQKMSKSRNNTIGLFNTDDQIRDAVMGIPTDSKSVTESKNPESCNVFALHKLFADLSELKILRERYLSGDIGYKESKDILIANISRFISPLRERRSEIESDREAVLKYLSSGGEQAREIANDKMILVKKAMGILIN